MSEKFPAGDRPAFGMDIEEFRRAAHQAVDLAADYLSGIDLRPVFRPMSAEERDSLLSRPLPQKPVSSDAILQAIRRHVLPHPMGNGHRRFFGWVNSPPAPVGVIAEFLASAINPSCAGGDHAGVYLERCTVRWLMELLGFPAQESMGLLVSGGSAASLTCLTAARHKAARDHGWDIRREGLIGHPQLVLYISEEGHSCLRKSAELLGLGERGVRVIPVDREFRMDPGALEAALRQDRAAGRIPFCVAASAGTVNTGAVDPIERLADLCERENLWLHVDGAYGALGILDPEVRDRFRGLERCDSLALDPHKWLSVPLECGCALLRDGNLLRDTFSLVPSYLRTEEGKGFGGLPWYSEYGFQQSRGFRALKLFSALLYAGREGIADQIRRHNRLARHLAERIKQEPELELLANPVLSVVNFRCVPQAIRGREDALNDLNKRVMEFLQSDGKVFLSGTQLRGRFSLRACILHYATREEDLDFLAACAVSAAGSLSNSPPQ
jgi:glutamate/tyrosine decarboxylase-like PLP-dependent enzyme